MTYKATILVVDDDHNNLKVLMDSLGQAGFRVLVATGGLAALEQARRLPPDLILLDVMMPDIDGFETCRRLKALPETREIPVIFMTALSELTHKVNGFEAGAVDYVTKPFQQEEVLMRVHTHLTLQRQKKELQQLNQQLAELNATKNRFFSIIAHDLKAAFAPLLSYIELLVESVEQENWPDVKQVVRALQIAGKTNFRLLDNLLSWARLQSEGIEFQPHALDLAVLAQETLHLLEPTARQKGISLSHAVAPGTAAYADANMIGTVLRNLVSNALKFTHPGGDVTISAQATADEVELVVEDTGIGIGPAYLPRLFQIDQSYRRAGTQNERGTGLGLILCKELVEKNGGRIWAESEEKQGTRVHFTLPARIGRSPGQTGR
jgi:signal transduction histidine kinase